MKTALAIGAFALAVTLFFSDVLFQDRALLTANPAAYKPWSAYAAADSSRVRTYRVDSILTYLPRQAELSRGLASGRLPLWNPYILGGTPFFADPQSRALYPPALALAPLRPEKAMGYDVALHFFLALVGMYLFLRSISASTTGSMIGAFAYGFSSFFFVRMGHPTFVASAAWIPFMFYGFERAKRSARGGTLLLAAFLAAGYLAGFPQVLMFGVACLVFYAGCLALDDAPRAPRAIGARSLRAARIVGVAGALSVLVVAVHLVPFVELLKNSVGLGIPVGMMEESFISKPVLLLRLVFPNLFGNPVEGTAWLSLVQNTGHPYNVGLMIYCGSGALLAALGSLAFAGSSSRVRALLLMLVAAVGVGTSRALFKAAYAVAPVLGYSQMDRVSVVACFALAALAGLGFSLVTACGDRRTRSIFIGLVLGAAAAVLGGSSAFLLRGDGILACLRDGAGAGAHAAATLPAQGADQLGKWIAQGTGAWPAYERAQVVRGLAFMLVSAGLIAASAALGRRRLTAVAGVVFLGWVIAEVVVAARTYYVSQPSPGAARTEGISGLVEKVGDPPAWRVASEESLYPVFPPNTNQIFGVQSLGGRATIMPRAYADLVGAGLALGRRVEQVGQGIDPASDLAGFMGVRYVLEGGYDGRLAQSPVLEAIAASGGEIGIAGPGGESRVAFSQPVGERRAVGIMIPGAVRLDFLVGLRRAADLDSLVVIAQCAVGSAVARTAVRLDAAALAGRWQPASLDIASLGVGHGSLTLEVRPVGQSGERQARPADLEAVWSGLEFVFADCPVREIAGGHAILPAARPAQGSPDRSSGEALWLDVASRASEVAFEIRVGSRRTVRRLTFGSNLAARALVIDLGPEPSGEVTVVSDSVFSLKSAKTVYSPRRARRAYDLVYAGDMHVFENSAAAARAICLDRSAVGVDGSGAAGTVPVAAVVGRIGDLECGQARVVSYRPERVEIRVSAGRDCWLLFQDTYYPGWKAYVDGSRTELLVTDVGTRALEVAHGDHTVVMKFAPTNFRLGLALSCLGLVLGAVYAAKSRYSGRARPS